MGQSWERDLPTVGTFSSPRLSDLNNDGVLDVVLGAGREEFIACDSAAFALDGKSGKMLWNVSASDQIFGSAAFLDITGDQINDVFIGGRSAELMAINGASGQIIWSFAMVNDLKKPSKEGWFNFYNVQFVPDRDNDGLPDILVSNGGDVLVEPSDPNRPPGHLVVISTQDGSVLQRAQMPDGKETYMSIGLIQSGNQGQSQIIYGTGGETIGGNLFICPLDDMAKGDLSSSLKLDSSHHKGFIGPSVTVDINDDTHADILTNAVDGRLLAFDGLTLDKLWDVELPNTESYSSLAVGYFTDDNIPDFFLSYAQGIWPHLDWSIQKMVNGKTGQVEFTDSMGFYQNTSPLAVDLNGDGRDEVVLSINLQEIDELYRKFFYTMLVSIDFSTGQIEKISDIFEGNNISSTPWIGDMDQDGKIDIIYCHGTNSRQTYTFDGMRIHRISTNIPMPEQISWGAYQGNQYNGVFVRRDNDK